MCSFEPIPFALNTLIFSRYQGVSVPHQQPNDPRLLEAAGGLARIESLSVLGAADADIM